MRDRFASVAASVTAELLRHCDQVVLNVRADNAPALQAYRRLLLRLLDAGVRRGDIAPELDLEAAATELQRTIDSLQTQIDALSAGSFSLLEGQILVGDTDDAAAAVTMSGDVTIDATGATEIGADKVGAAELANDAVDSAAIAAEAVTLAKLARGTNGQVIVGQTGADPVYRTLSGDVTLDAAGAKGLPLQGLIESPAAVHRAFDIAGHPRMQSLSFGLMDFVSAHGGAIPSAGMGVQGQFTHPLVVRAKLEIASACHAHGKVPSHGVVTEFKDQKALLAAAEHEDRSAGHGVHHHQVNREVEAHPWRRAVSGGIAQEDWREGR